MTETEVVTPIVVGGPCDRCGKAEDARPYRLTDTITYRGRVIEYPWLCRKCMMAENRKWWKERGL